MSPFSSIMFPYTVSCGMQYSSKSCGLRRVVDVFSVIQNVSVFDGGSIASSCLQRSWCISSIVSSKSSLSSTIA